MKIKDWIITINIIFFIGGLLFLLGEIIKSFSKNFRRIK